MSTSKRLGAAFHALAVEEGAERELLLDLKRVARAFEENPDYVKILDSPRIERGDLTRVLNEDFTGRVNRYTINFIKILCQKRMAHNIGECLGEYEALYNKRHNIKTASVTTAKPLSGELCKRLIKKLEEKTGGRVELTNRVDEDCIGGIIIEIDGKQIDFSIKAELENLRKALIE